MIADDSYLQKLFNFLIYFMVSKLGHSKKVYNSDSRRILLLFRILFTCFCFFFHPERIPVELTSERRIAIQFSFASRMLLKTVYSTLLLHTKFLYKFCSTFRLCGSVHCDGFYMLELIFITFQNGFIGFFLFLFSL